MIAEHGKLDALKEEAHRTFMQHLALRITEALDQMAGPRALSPAEQQLQQVCREEFGLYDPGCDKQLWFVRRLQALATATAPRGSAPVPHPVEPMPHPIQPMPHPIEPTPARVSDQQDDELMAAFLEEEQRSAGRGRRFRRPVQATPPPTVRRDHRRRTDWGNYLARWRGSDGRGSGGDDDGDPSRSRLSPSSSSRSCSRARSRPYRSCSSRLKPTLSRQSSMNSSSCRTTSSSAAGLTVFVTI